MDRQVRDSMLVELQACHADDKVELSRHSRAVVQKAGNPSPSRRCVLSNQYCLLTAFAVRIDTSYLDYYIRRTQSGDRHSIRRASSSPPASSAVDPNKNFPTDPMCHCERYRSTGEIPMPTRILHVSRNTSRNPVW